MNIDNVDHSAAIDLKEAEVMGRRSDVGLLVVSFIYLINLLFSVVFVWYNTYTADNLLINAVILVENIILMGAVVYTFNKYKL